jgi:hypothetical protein
MTRKAKKILITTETVEMTTIHRSRPVSIRTYCPDCYREVDWQDIHTVTALLTLAADEATGLRPLGSIQCWSDPDGRTLVCPNCLSILRKSRN